MAKTVRYNQLTPRVLVDCPAYMAQKVTFALSDAAREFCRRSTVWRERLAAIDVVADQQSYTLSTDWDAHFHAATELYLRTATDVTNGDDGRLTNPARYKFVLPQTLKFETGFIPQTAVTSGLLVEVILVPTLGATEIAEWIIDRWGEYIIARAKAELWKSSDVNKTAMYLQQYYAGLNEAMVEALKDPTPEEVGNDIVQTLEFIP